MSANTPRLEFHHTVNQPGITVVDCLAAQTTLSKQQIKQCLAKGAVWLQKGKQQQRLRRVKKVLNTGEQIHLYFDPQILAQPVPEASLIADLKRYSVWYKPACMLAQGTMWGDHCSLLRFAEQFFTPARQSFLVHRLDREASGLMLIAHDKQSAAALSDLFQKRHVDKHYRVSVMGELASKTLTIDQPLDGKTASTELTLLEYSADKNQSFLQITIDSGRKHQIRRHCAAVGHPVVGDGRYGRADPAGLQLQAISLAFDCPLTRQHQAFSLIDKPQRPA